MVITYKTLYHILIFTVNIFRARKVIYGVSKVINLDKTHILKGYQCIAMFWYWLFSSYIDSVIFIKTYTVMNTRGSVSCLNLNFSIAYNKSVTFSSNFYTKSIRYELINIVVLQNIFVDKLFIFGYKILNCEQCHQKKICSMFYHDIFLYRHVFFIIFRNCFDISQYRTAMFGDCKLLFYNSTCKLLSTCKRYHLCFFDNIIYNL